MITTAYESNNNAVQAGEYEVVIRAAKEGSTKGGTGYLNISMQIRKDVQQPFSGAMLYHKIWRARNPKPEDLQVNGYLFFRVMELAKAVKIPAGKNYENLQQLLSDLMGKPVRVSVSTYDNNGYTNYDFDSIKPSEIPLPPAQYAPQPPVQGQYAPPAQSPFANYAPVPPQPAPPQGQYAPNDSNLSDFECINDATPLPF